MNYPKMLYKGEPKYTDNEQLRNDLFSKELKTIIVADPDQEEMRREQGYVDLSDLMYKPKPKVVITESEEIAAGSHEIDPIRQKRKYVKKVKAENVGHDAE